MPRTQRQLRADPSKPFTTLAKINPSSRFRHPDMQRKLEQRGRAGARCRKGIPSCLCYTVPAGTGAPRLSRLLPSPARGRRCSHGARNKRGRSAERPGLRGAAALHGTNPWVYFFPYQLSNEGVGREFSCPLEQEPFSHKNHPSLSSARSGAAVPRCPPGLAARPGKREGAGQALTGSSAWVTQVLPPSNAPVRHGHPPPQRGCAWLSPSAQPRRAEPGTRGDKHSPGPCGKRWPQRGSPDPAGLCEPPSAGKFGGSPLPESRVRPAPGRAPRAAAAAHSPPGGGCDSAGTAR